MKKWLISGMIFVSILFCGVPGHSQERILEIYKNIVKMAEKTTPSSYTVEIENKKFKEALEELPEDILTGKGAPAVKIQFAKGVGVKIIIENIKSEYATLFQCMRNILNFQVFQRSRILLNLNRLLITTKRISIKRMKNL